MQTGPRVCLGIEAPAGLADLLEKVGLQILPWGQKHHASLYVDFVGARPAGVSMISLDMARPGRDSRAGADFVTDNITAAACYVMSRAWRMPMPFLTLDDETFTAIRTAVSVASSRVPIIVEGEIGTGKQSFARLIHSASNRSGNFVTLNCAALFDDQLDTEMPSVDKHPDDPGSCGKIAGAAAGTLLLDEVGELSLNAQVRLLHIIQAGESTPPGSEDRGVRFIAATNRTLAQMVQNGSFRNDLYWRLNVFTTGLPPLRKREADIPLLARHFLRGANPRRQFTSAAIKMLASYPFPGNVRELQNLVARLAVIPLSTDGPTIDCADIRRQLVFAERDMPAAQTSGWTNSREEARREMVLRVIASCAGDRAAAARKLGITPRALQYHITKAGLSRKRGARRIGYEASLTPTAVANVNQAD